MLIQALDHKLIKENATLLEGKVTGMLLETMDLSPLAALVESPAALQKKVEELVPELERRIRSGAPVTVYGPCGPLAIFGPMGNPLGGPKGFLSQEEKNSNARSGPGKLPDSKYAAFLCHDRGTDSQGRENHTRVMRIQEALARRGVQAWVDEEEMKGDIDSAGVAGVDITLHHLVVRTTECYSKHKRMLFKIEMKPLTWNEAHHTFGRPKA